MRSIAPDARRGVASLQLLADLLPERVSSPLSLNALRESLEASHRALTHWIEIFERLYYIFRIRPFASLRVRSLQKMPKAYLCDWSVVPSEGARFENLVASHLNKFCETPGATSSKQACACSLRNASWAHWRDDKREVQRHRQPIRTPAPTV